MAHYLIPEPDPDSAKPDSAEPNSAEPVQRAAEPTGETAQAEGVQESFASDLEDLRAKFSSDEGGHLSEELSTELALEVVLNEIVERACVLTGATGSAVVLQRDGEWECRASNGANAPGLGARLGKERGLIAECIKTAQVQCCADSETDSRIDAEACRNLGVRSVVALPLFRDAALVGVFAAFSGQTSAFGEHEAGTFGALSRSITRTLELTYRQGERPTEKSSTTSAYSGAEATADGNQADRAVPENAVGTDAVERIAEEKVGEAAAWPPRSELEEFRPEPEHTGKKRRQDLITWLLGAAVLASAVFLITMASRRLLGNGARRHSSSVQGKNQPPASRASIAAPIEPTSSATAQGAAGASTTVAKPRDSATPEGGLTVFQNGKEVFRMAPRASLGEMVQTAETNGAGGTSTGDVAGSNVDAITPQKGESSLIRRVEPIYPKEALKEQIQGSVVLKVRAGRDGAVQEVTPLSGEPMLANAAISAVKQWRFKPPRINGQPAEMETQVTLNFRLSQ